jgi:hypothetical protein
LSINQMEFPMKLSKTSGTVLAATAAALLFAGVVNTSRPAEAGAKTVHCLGVNSCKGTSACKTGSSACKGQNACKGQGFLELTKADCKAKGGKIG